MVAPKSRKHGQRNKSEPHSWAASLLDPRWMLVVAVSGIGAYLTASHGLLYTAGAWQIPLFVGCVVGLVARDRVQAAVVAAPIMIVGVAALPPALPFGATIQPVEFVLAPAIAAGSGALLAHARTAHWRGRTAKFNLLAAVVLVCWILVNFWLPLFIAGLPVQGYGVMRAGLVSEVPQPGAYQLDAEIYRRVYYLMHQGQSYYPAFRDAFTQNGRPEYPAPSSAFGYRLPTFFLVWRLLPPDLFSIVYLFLGMATVGIVAAAVISGQLVDARFAPLGAAAMTAYAMAVAITGSVTYVDLPAMSIALVGVALFLHAVKTGNRTALWTAAGVLTLAALTREILVYLIAFAALSALLESPGDRRKAATPWLVALGVFALGYAAHAIAVAPFLSPKSNVTYSRGSIAFVWSAITNFSSATSGGELALLSLYLLGLAGAYAAHKRVGRPFSAFAVGALVVPLALMLRVGNNSLTAEGEIFNYWGLLVMPLALALWPAWVLALWRGKDAKP